MFRVSKGSSNGAAASKEHLFYIEKETLTVVVIVLYTGAGALPAFYPGFFGSAFALWPELEAYVPRHFLMRPMKGGGLRNNRLNGWFEAR